MQKALLDESGHSQIYMSRVAKRIYLAKVAKKKKAFVGPSLRVHAFLLAALPTDFSAPKNTHTGVPDWMVLDSCVNKSIHISD